MHRFSPTDESAWRAHLVDEGYVVLSGVLGPEEVHDVKEKQWQWFEQLNSGLRRDDPSTWTNANWPGAANLGFLSTHAGGHSEAAWQIRGHPSVISSFQAVWQTDEPLLSSMDTFIAWRPWLSDQTAPPQACPIVPGEDWTPRVERLHIDQSPVNKKGLCCVQGMVPLEDVTRAVGGLQVVPRSHSEAKQDVLAAKYPSATGDWLELPEDDCNMGTGVLLEASAGDLILWDSRLIHGGLVGGGNDGDSESSSNRAGQQRLPRLPRLSLTVSMTPVSFCKNGGVLDQRQKAYENGLTLTHWPHEFAPHDLGDTGGQNIDTARVYEAPKLNAAQLRLIRGGL